MIAMTARERIDGKTDTKAYNAAWAESHTQPNACNPAEMIELDEPNYAAASQQVVNTNMSTLCL